MAAKSARFQSNYCVCFIDLLGQRAILQGEGLMPSQNDEDKWKKFQKKVLDSVGSIEVLQNDAKDFVPLLNFEWVLPA